MNRTVKHIVGCLITLAMIVAGVQRLGFLTRPADSGNMDGAFTQIDSFYNLPDHTVEVIIYGSSHAFKSVDPIAMYNAYGIGAYNYSWNWQRLNTTKLFLQDSLVSQSPRVAIVETRYINSLLKNVDMNGEIYYTRYLRDSSKNRFEYLKRCFGNDLERWLSYYMPLAAFHDNWPNLKRRSFTPVINNHNYRMGLGVSDTIKKIELPDMSKVKQKKLRRDSIAEMNEIVQICKDHNIELVFYTAPYGGEFPYTDAIADFARKKGCAYINMFEHLEECGIDPNTDFRDGGHTNSSGAAKIGKYLGKYLSEHYDLTDMRQIENNPWSKVK